MAENTCTKSRAREYRSKKPQLCDRIISFASNSGVTRKDVMIKFNLSTEQLRIQMNKIQEKYGVNLFS